MALLSNLTQYYHADYNVVDNGGGTFQISVTFAHALYYNGDGSELGGGWKTPLEQLRAVADGIAAGLLAGNSPYYASVTTAQISAQPGGPNVLYTKPA